MARSKPGIRVRHVRACAGDPCTCPRGKKRYQARCHFDGKTRVATFASEDAARAWLTDVRHAASRGALAAPSPVTVAQAAAALLEAMRDGTELARGKRYKPSTIRSYAASLRTYVLSEDEAGRPASDGLGPVKLMQLDRRRVQAFADGLRREHPDWSPSTIRNVLMPLRVIVRRAIRDGVILADPTDRLTLEAVTTRRKRTVEPRDIGAYLQALPADLRALWATAFYTGMRRGELQALTWECVGGDAIRVEAGWDAKEGPVAPKSDAGVRRIPMIEPLRLILAEHRLATGRVSGLVFAGRVGAFTPTNVGKRSRAAFVKAGLEPVTLHEARHTFASTVIASGASALEVKTYAGHSSVQVTYDIYGHLFRSREAETVARLGAAFAQPTGHGVGHNAAP